MLFISSYFIFIWYFPQVYLEECKYKVKIIQMSRFINAELDSESDLDDELKSDSDNDSK